MPDLDDFDYDLPTGAVAQQPLADRSASRLLVDQVGPDGRREIAHRHARDLPDLLVPGDVVVVNTSRVVPGRLRLRKPTGGSVEVLLLEPVGDDPAAGRWEALVRPSRRVRPGTELVAGPDLTIEVGADLGEGRRHVMLRTEGDPMVALARHGEAPLPPYIVEPLAEPDRYQTVYATAPGSAAAPTAGLHFTPELLARCRMAGAEIVGIELHIGLDTFRPVTAEVLDEHRMHEERYRVSSEAWEAVQAARRVVAVGTTVVRTLETVAARGERSGRTDLFIRRPYPFRVVDVLLTNFHLPRSTLLVLLDAFIGDRWRELYARAIAEGYRFLSFGDAMWTERARVGAS